MKPVRIHLVAGARPNFMKVGPLYHELSRRSWADARLVHTGQHHDEAMSERFFHELELPPPHHHLGVGSGTHAEQTARIMVAYERLCMDERPDWTVVVGDVNSTLACALAAKKLVLPVAHLEAGLRSGDRTMPEEINRLATDSISDLLWTPSPDADENLLREGIAPERIERVGNIMIDSYVRVQDRIAANPIVEDLGLAPHGFALVTLHRPANVDDPAVLSVLVEHLVAVARRRILVFPIHPRTRERLRTYGLLDRLVSEPGVRLIEPLGYIAFQALVARALFILTDSGGVQEETTYLGIPCLTVRETTERPITVTQGSNRLVTLASIEDAVERVLGGSWPRGSCPDLWDGRTAHRVADSLARHAGVPA